MGIFKVLESPLDITTSTIIRRIVSNHEAYQVCLAIYSQFSSVGMKVKVLMKSRTLQEFYKMFHTVHVIMFINCLHIVYWLNQNV